MCNIVIYNNNLNFIKKYSNILVNFDNARIIGIISTKSELANICDNNKVDLIILDNISYSKKRLKPLLNTIKEKIIVDNMISNYKKADDHLYISNSANTALVINIFSKYISELTEKRIRENTRKLLKSLNFDFKLKGTNYLIESIVYSYINKNKYLYDNLEKNIYTHVSKQYNVSVSVIKQSIIRTLNNTSSNRLKSTFKNLDKITSKTFITEVINLL